jgi:hypothetical protein
MKPGLKARYDYEYERNGTANLFMMFAPLEGWCHVKVTALGRVEASINLLNALNGQGLDTWKSRRLACLRCVLIGRLQRLAAAGSSKVSIGFPTA